MYYSYQQIYMSKTGLGAFTWHVLAVSQVSGVKLVLLERTLKKPLVQGHSVVFGQNICYIKRVLLFLPETCRESLYPVCEVFKIFKNSCLKNNYPQIYIF